jgi:hypothetical protein
MNPHTTIQAPGPGEDATFTLEVWEQHDMPPILYLAAGWTTIEEQAFVDNPDLEEIHIPASVVSIQEDAFNGAISLRQVEFAQDSLLHGDRLFIGDGVFADTEALKRINIPARVTHIGDGAFLGATGLEQITFGEGSQLEMIGFQTFAGATALQTIRIPASVTEISIEAFHNATSLTEVTFEEGSQLEFIGDSAFDGARALEIIQIPAGVGHIGQGAFRNASSLQTIRIPRLVQTLMRMTFENATSLREVTFEEGSEIISIGDGAFMGATALETIKIPAEVQVIRQGAFQNATALQTIRIPRLVREIGYQAFANTSSLRELIFEKNSEITHIGHQAFRDSSLLIVSIGEAALVSLNTDRANNNMPRLRFGKNDFFYGKRDVTIVSRTRQINALALSLSKPEYKTQGFFSKLIGKPKKKTREAIPQDLIRKVARLITDEDVEPKSGNTLPPPEFAAAVAAAYPAEIAAANARIAAIDAEEAAKAAKGGARKYRTRKRGIRRRSRKALGTRRMQKRKSKRRRTMKRK